MRELGVGRARGPSLGLRQQSPARALPEDRVSQGAPRWKSSRPQPGEVVRPLDIGADGRDDRA